MPASPEHNQFAAPKTTRHQPPHTFIQTGLGEQLGRNHHHPSDNLLPGMPELMSHSHPQTQSIHVLPPSQASSSSAQTTAPSSASVHSSTPYPYFTSPNSDLSPPFYGSGSNCGSTGVHLSPKQYTQRQPKGGRSQGKTRKSKTY